MVANRKSGIRQRAPRTLHIREWRKYMGTKPMELAIALGIERQSYHRLEKNWHTINAGEMAILAKVIGVEPSQFWFLPPQPNERPKESLDDMLEDVPPEVAQMALQAVKGMLGK